MTAGVTIAAFLLFSVGAVSSFHTAPTVYCLRPHEAFSEILTGLARTDRRRRLITTPFLPTRFDDYCGLRASPDIDCDDREGGGRENNDASLILRIDLSVLPGVDARRALELVRSRARSFPFAAVLPVQPLTYAPTEGGTGGGLGFRS